MAVFLGGLGFAMTLVTIALSFFPAPEETNKPLAVAKLALITIATVGGGVLVYALERRGRGRGAGRGAAPGPSPLRD